MKRKFDFCPTNVHVRRRDQRRPIATPSIGHYNHHRVLFPIFPAGGGEGEGVVPRTRRGRRRRWRRRPSSYSGRTDGRRLEIDPAAAATCKFNSQGPAAGMGHIFSKIPQESVENPPRIPQESRRSAKNLSMSPLKATRTSTYPPRIVGESQRISKNLIQGSRSKCDGGFLGISLHCS